MLCSNFESKASNCAVWPAAHGKCHGRAAAHCALCTLSYAVLCSWLTSTRTWPYLDTARTSGLYKRPLIINTKQAGALSVASFWHFYWLSCRWKVLTTDAPARQPASIASAPTMLATHPGPSHPFLPYGYQPCWTQRTSLCNANEIENFYDAIAAGTSWLPRESRLMRDAKGEGQGEGQGKGEWEWWTWGSSMVACRNAGNLSSCIKLVNLLLIKKRQVCWHLRYWGRRVPSIILIASTMGDTRHSHTPSSHGPLPCLWVFAA